MQARGFHLWHRKWHQNSVDNDPLWAVGKRQTQSQRKTKKKKQLSGLKGTYALVTDFILLGSRLSADVIAAMKLKYTCSLEEKLWPT